MLLYFSKAWFIGLAIAAPVGPIGILCIRKTLELGFIGKLAVGLGAALADSVYGLIAALGLSTIEHFLLQYTNIIKICGGIFLLYLAYTEIKSTPPAISSNNINTTNKFKQTVITVFFLTLTNPMTILSFIGIFASISNGANNFYKSLIMISGIFLGSMTWWLILGKIILSIKNKLPETWFVRIKYLSALILAVFGICAILIRS